MRVRERRDEQGRVVGLVWPEPSPDEPEPKPARTFTGTPNLGGRPRQDLCGAGEHDMAVHGREIKTGSKGRYCNACKNKRARQARARRKESG